MSLNACKARQMHARFRGKILQPLVTQHAKTTSCVPQVTAKELNMHKAHSQKTCMFAVNSNVKVQHGTPNPQKTELNPQVEKVF